MGVGVGVGVIIASGDTKPGMKMAGNNTWMEKNLCVPTKGCDGKSTIDSNPDLEPGCFRFTK